MNRIMEHYFRLRSFEADGQIYERLGIRLFKKCVPGGDVSNCVLRRFKPGFRSVRDEPSLRRWLQRTRENESVHLVSSAVILLAMAYCLAVGNWRSALCWLVWTIPFDLYPIMLQRYNRARLTRALGRRRQP